MILISSCQNLCTCAFTARILSLRGAEEPAVKVFFPKFSKPHVPAIVLEGEGSKVFIKPWEQRKEENGSVPDQLSTNSNLEEMKRSCGGACGGGC